MTRVFIYSSSGFSSSSSSSESLQSVFGRWLPILSSSIPSGLPVCRLLPLRLNPLQHRPSIFYVVIFFALPFPFIVAATVFMAFVGFAFFQHERTYHIS